MPSDSKSIILNASTERDLEQHSRHSSNAGRCAPRRRQPIPFSHTNAPSSLPGGAPRGASDLLRREFVAPAA